MPRGRSKSKSKAKPKSRSRSKGKQVVTSSNVCVLCNEWDDPADYGCEECCNAYHDTCLDEEFRGGAFQTCEDLGKECDFEGPSVTFEFGPKIDAVIKPKRTRTKRGSNRSRLGGSNATKVQQYKACTFMGVEYCIGDDVEFSLEKEHGLWGVGRITRIVKESDVIPSFGVIWFWRAKELNSGTTASSSPSSDMESSVSVDENRGSDPDIEGHELLLDEDYAQVLEVVSLVDSSVSCKVLVVESTDEYLRQIKSKEYESSYYDVFWCTHAYSDKSKKKSLICPNAIQSRRTTHISPAPPAGKKQSRKRTRLQQIEQSLHDASVALMLSSVPTVLPCRQQEHDQIEQFMRQQISCSGQGSGLYLSGMPGTGKTATVRQIAKELQRCTVASKRKSSKTALPEFEFHEINAMKLPTPKHLYTDLCKKLLDTYSAPNTAVKKLEKYFATRDSARKVCVLLVDELDYLLTRQQKVMYNIFDWPTQSTAKLVVIGIANTMDLKERVLPRVASRMGTTRVVFKSYKREQLTEILQHRLQQTKVFSDDAIRYCAMAVAGVSGDCRTALQICRRAVELAQADVHEHGIDKLQPPHKKSKSDDKNKNKKSRTEFADIVALEHIKKAKAAFDQSNDFVIISNLSIYEQLFLTAMVMYNKQHDGYVGMTEKYRQKFDMFVQTQLGDRVMSNVHFRNMLDGLKDMGVINITFEKKEWVEWIKFNIPNDEAEHALKEQDLCAKILSLATSRT